MRTLFLIFAVFLVFALLPSRAWAACSGGAPAGTIEWMTDHFEYCDGTNWQEFGGSGGGPYAIYWKWHQTNSFPSCDTGGVQLACQRGNGTTTPDAEYGWEVDPDRQSLRLDYNSDGFSDVVYGWVTNGGTWAYRYDTSGYTDYFRFYIGPPNYVPQEYGSVAYRNGGGSNYDWGWCLCAMGAP